jgi:hypothetical protein
LSDLPNSYLGTPYLYAGASEKGFDCTGFVYFVFNHFGIKTSRSSSGFENAEGFTETEHAQKGDIILFTGTNSEIIKSGSRRNRLQKCQMASFSISYTAPLPKIILVLPSLASPTSPGYQKRYLRVINIL